MNVKNPEEMERLNAIFAEVEKAEKAEFEADSKAYKSSLEAAKKNQVEQDKTNHEAKVQRLIQQDPSQIASQARQLINDNACKTKWERVFANAYIELFKEVAFKNSELNVLRNFANSVDHRLQCAERSAKEQDNHHYFKIFAESVRKMIDKM